MSNFQDDIFLTVLQAKDTTGIWAENFIQKEKAGEEISRCCQLQLVLLVKWIEIMECYYSTHFSANGNITPDYDCLTLVQAQELVAKIKTFIGV